MVLKVKSQEAKGLGVRVRGHTLHGMLGFTFGTHKTTVLKAQRTCYVYLMITLTKQ